MLSKSMRILRKKIKSSTMTIKKLFQKDISGFKLLIATVSTGNVAQLSADLFIESVKMEKFALFWNPAIIPILGPSAFNEKSDELTISSEFFISEKDKLVILQTRTPLSAALLSNFFDELVQFIRDEKLAEVIILTSTFSHEQHHIGKSPFEFKANEFIIQKSFGGFNESSAQFAIPGSGFSLKLHRRVTEELKIPSVILYSFISEGDNFYDGIQLCQNVNNYLKVIPEVESKIQIKVPISWKFLFGRDVNREIY